MNKKIKTQNGFTEPETKIEEEDELQKLLDEDLDLLGELPQ